MQYTRRELGKLALSAIPAASLLPRFAVAAERPNSTVNGVTIGMNVPYNFGQQATTAEDILQRTVQLGVSGVELRARPGRSVHGSADESPAAARGRRGQSRRRARRTACRLRRRSSRRRRRRGSQSSASGARTRRWRKRATCARCTRTPA